MANVIIKPLKTLDELQLKVSSQKEFTADFSQKDDLMKIVSKELEKVPGAMIFQGLKDGPKALSVLFKSNSNEHVYLPEPNPILVYYKIAIENIIKAEDAKSLYLQTQNLTKENYDSFVAYFENAIVAITFLVTCVEGFCNQLIPDDFVITIDDKELNKSKIEWKDLKTKIKIVLPAIEDVNFFQSNLEDYNNILELQKLRNDLVHLKKETLENKTSYQNLIQKIHDIEFEKYKTSIKTFIDTLRPNLIEEQ